MINDLSEMIALDLYGRSARESIEMALCVKCGNDASTFIDDLSRKEYTLSGYCQVCQDQIFAYAKEIDDA